MHSVACDIGHRLLGVGNPLQVHRKHRHSNSRREHWGVWRLYRKEGNVLFNDTLNTFYLRLYGVRHMVRDHSDSEKGNLLPPHRLLFLITARVLLYAPSHRQDSTYHDLCYTSHGALAGTRNSSMGSSHEGSIRHHEQTLLPRSYISLRRLYRGRMYNNMNNDNIYLLTPQ